MYVLFHIQSYLTTLAEASAVDCSRSGAKGHLLCVHLTFSSCHCFVMATSSSNESIYVQRKRQRRANFLSGRARSAHRLPESLETSLVETSAPPTNDSTQQTSLECKRGCPQILCGLRATFDAVGLHPAKAHQKRQASYPLPTKRQKRAHRNITGQFRFHKNLYE